MYVNINRYLKIYLSNPPFIIYTPRSNTWKKAKGKKGKIRPPNVNVCETTLTYLLFFTIFSTFLCYRRKFSVKSSTGREIRGGFLCSKIMVYKPWEVQGHLENLENLMFANILSDNILMFENILHQPSSISLLPFDFIFQKEMRSFSVKFCTFARRI